MPPNDRNTRELLIRIDERQEFMLEKVEKLEKNQPIIFAEINSVKSDLRVHCETTSTEKKVKGLIAVIVVQGFALIASIVGTVYTFVEMFNKFKLKP